MNKRDHSQVIQECVTFFSNPATDRRFDEAWDYIHELTLDDPQDALSLIIELSNATTDHKLLSRLGAGPLESLLRISHGRFIPDVIVEARRNPNFRVAVLDMWLDTEDVPEALLEELERSVPGFEKYPGDTEEQ